MHEGLRRCRILRLSIGGCEYNPPYSDPPGHPRGDSRDCGALGLPVGNRLAPPRGEGRGLLTRRGTTPVAVPTPRRYSAVNEFKARITQTGNGILSCSTCPTPGVRKVFRARALINRGWGTPGLY